jgi:glutathione S-transferase
MPLTFYGHPLSSYCWKVLIALYENDTPFEYRRLDNEETAGELARLWPLAKMPILVEDGRAIVESSMLIEYLDLCHPGPVRFVPADPEAALRVRTLDRIFDNYVMTPMQRIVGDRLRPAEARDLCGVGEARSLLAKTYAWLEGELGDAGWAAGAAFTLADCAAAPSLHYAHRVQPISADHRRLRAYLARLEARPSVARVLAEAAPFAHMFPQEPA